MDPVVSPAVLVLSGLLALALGVALAFAPAALRGWRRSPGGSSVVLLLRSFFACSQLGAALLVASFCLGQLLGAPVALALALSAAALTFALVPPVTYVGLVRSGLRAQPA